VQIAILLVACLGAIGTLYLVSIERSRRHDERTAAKRATITVRFERREAGPSVREFLVIANDGRAEARDIDLVTFNSHVDGRPALDVISDRSLLPIRRLGSGSSVALEVIQDFGGPNAPWSVAVQWTDELGPHVLEDLIVTLNV
jgi:hypothetical protein